MGEAAAASGAGAGGVGTAVVIVLYRAVDGGVCVVDVRWEDVDRVSSLPPDTEAAMITPIARTEAIAAGSFHLPPFEDCARTASVLRAAFAVGPWAGRVGEVHFCPSHHRWSCGFCGSGYQPAGGSIAFCPFREVYYLIRTDELVRYSVICRYSKIPHGSSRGSIARYQR